MTKDETIVLLGGTGALGQFVSRYLSKRGSKVEALSSKDAPIRMGHHIATLNSVKSKNPAAVINLAGFVRELSLTKPKEEVLDLNSAFPQTAGTFFHELGIPFVHISTDCVFTGDSGPYSESSKSDATDMYGLSKAMGDTAHAMILRGSYLGPGIPPSHYGLFDWIQSKKNSAMGGFTNQYWNGITYLKLAQILERIVAHGKYEPGVFHLPAETVSRYELVRKVSETFGLNIELEPETAAKPINRILATEKSIFSSELAEPLSDQLEKLRNHLN